MASIKLKSWPVMLFQIYVKQQNLHLKSISHMNPKP